MKAEKKPTRPKAARSTASGELVLDPFAEDLFALSKPAPVVTFPEDLPDLAEMEQLPVVPWQSRLPLYPRRQAQFSAELAELPAEVTSFFWQKSRSILARYTQVPEENVATGWFELRSSTAGAFEDQTGNVPQTFIALRLEPGNHPFLLAMEATFGVCLTDKVLGGPGEPPDSLRNLSTGERAVIEFLALQTLRELDQADTPFALRLEQIGPAIPAWLNESVPEWGLGITALGRLQVGPIDGLFRVYLPAPTARSLARPGFPSAPTRTGADLRSFASLAPDFSSALLIGRTELNTEELVSLELGDVVVIEWPQVEWNNRNYHNSVDIRIGDGNQAILRGLALNQNDSLSINLTEIIAGNVPTLVERLDMEIPLEEEVAPVEEATEETGEGAALLDAIMLTVHVELASRRVRLDELARLRVNQVLELGCKATDSVDLLVDGRRVARGELVDIEGRLGVRITHLA